MNGMGSVLEYVLVEHLRLAVLAAILFAVGLFVSPVVARLRIAALEWLPLQLFRLIMRLVGPGPSLARMAGVIWVFNSAAMFVYMASGYHPLAPRIIGVWTGLNIGIVAARARSDEAGLAGLMVPRAGQWAPPAGLAWMCGALVLLLELPCFWYALGMGMSLGGDVQREGVQYLAALRPRAWAYLLLIVPTLLVSAVAEAIAIRAGTAAARGE